MNPLLLYGLAVFAVYRVSLMVGIEDGPFAVFKRFRDGIFARFGNGWLNDGVNCPLCLSFWFTLVAVLVLMWQLGLAWDSFFWLWLGLAGLVAFLHLVSQSAK